MEYLVALETASNRCALEIFDSHSASRMMLTFASPDVLQQVLRWITFACTVSKSKFRMATRS